MKHECMCSMCGADVWPTQQYMIGHDITADGRVIHTVTHFDCLIKPTSRSGEVLPTNRGVADHTPEHGGQ